MKKALVLRGSMQLGDLLFVSWVPEILKKKKKFNHVTVATWNKNKPILDNNPFVDDVIVLDELEAKYFGEEDIFKQWQNEYDEIFDFRFTVEKKYLKNSSENIFNPDTLREIAKGKNYYWDALENFGLNGYKGKGSLYLNYKEKTNIKFYKKQGKKRIAWQILGGGRNKILFWAPAYINEIAKKDNTIEHWLVGDIQNTLSTLHANVVDKRGEWTVREAIAHIPIFDLVIGPESFFVNAAGALDIPTLTFFSHSAPENLTEYFKNAYSVIPQCDCHPCYLIVKDFRKIDNLYERKLAREQEKRCGLRDGKDRFKMLGFKCCLQINHKETIDKILTIVKGV